MISGTKAVYDACKLHKLKKLIETSSAYCIMGVLSKEKGATYDENDHCPITKIDGYTDSKTIEEQMLLEFVKD
jgi:nucleoside-diphosphate-sugar epimerase